MPLSTVVINRGPTGPAGPEGPEGPEATRDVLTRVADFAIADAEANTLQEVVTTGEIIISLDAAVAVGVEVDLLVSGAGKLTLTPTGGASVVGPWILFGSGSVHTVTKINATDWRVTSALGGYSAETLAYAHAVGATSEWALGMIENRVAAISGDTEDAGYHGARWDEFTADRRSALHFCAAFDRRLTTYVDAMPEVFRQHDVQRLEGSLAHPILTRDGFLFDGVNDLLFVSHHADFNAPSITVMMRLKLRDNTDRVMGFAETRNSNNADGLNLASVNGVPRASIIRGSNEKRYNLDAIDLRDDKWHTFAMTFEADATDGTLRMFIDGVEGTPTKLIDAAVAEYASEQTFRIGRWGSFYANIEVSDVLFFGTNLPAAEIKSLHDIIS